MLRPYQATGGGAGMSSFDKPRISGWGRGNNRQARYHYEVSNGGGEGPVTSRLRAGVHGGARTGRQVNPGTRPVVDEPL